MSATQEGKNIQAVSVGLLLILLVGGFFVFRTFWSDTSSEDDGAVATTDTAQEEINYPTVTAAVIRQKMLNGDPVVFLDVRDQASFEKAHIPHSILTSPSALSSYAADQKTLVVIVFSELDTTRKEAVGNILRQKSYPAFLLKGGIEEWQRGGNQVLSFGDPTSFVDQAKVTNITPEEALQDITAAATNLYFLDVQSEENYRKKHIKGAVNIPLNQLEKRSQEIPPGKSIIVYGETDLVSFQGGVRLYDLNVFTAKTLTGNDHLKPESKLPLEP